MLPDFLGIGAPKAATTWLFHCLQEHPQIFVASSKEVGFFDYGSIEGRQDTYEKHFANAQGARAVGEFSTRYLASTRAPARIKRLIPQARLIVSLRNPVDQVYSHYWHLRRQNFHRLDTDVAPLSFEQALERIGDRLLEPAFYHSHLTRWLQYFERDRIHVILYEEVVERPAGVIADLYRFLGVDPRFVPASLNASAIRRRRGGVPRSPLAERVHRRLYTLLTRRIYTPLKALVGVRGADRLKRLLRARELLEGSFFTAGYPPMRRETRSRLAAIYTDDIGRLEHLLGRSLDIWRERSEISDGMAMASDDTRLVS